MSDTNRVVVEVAIAVPVDAVWRALRDPAEVRRWFGWDNDGLDAEIEEIFISEPSVSEPDRTIRWDSGHQLVLAAHGRDQTLVRVTGAQDEIGDGWRIFVQQLRFALARHRGEDRRTVHLARPSDAGAPLPADVLALAAVGSIPPGERYEVTLATGDELAGEVWFRSERQVGLTVDGYGDGLLVADPRRVIVTTYGLDDASFGRLRDRWAEWWRARLADVTVE
jgi:uncharacterized protein YndB with AHSA1/START domain